MSTGLLSTYDSLLKERYSPFLLNAINQSDPALKLFTEADDAQWDGRGRRYLVGILLSYANTIMALGENSNLPEAEASNGNTLNIPIRYINDSISLSAQAMQLSEGDANAFISAMQLEMQAKVYSLSRTMGRILYGSGRGAIAQVNGTFPIGSTTISVDNPGLKTSAIGGTRYITPGMRLMVLDPTDTTFVTTVKVLTVSSAGTSFTVAATTVAIADNSILYIAHSDTSSSIVNQSNKNYEPMGLEGMVNDATGFPTYFGLSRVTFPNLESRVINAGGALTDDLLQRCADAVQMYGANDVLGGETVIIGEPAFRRAYIALTTAIRRYTGEYIMKPDVGTVATKGGNLMFGDIPIISSRNAPYDEAVFLNTAGLKRITNLEGWDDTTGSIWKQVTNSGGRLSQYVADWRKWCNFYHSDPRSCVRLIGITGLNTVYFPTF